jgi:sugar transferase (PEP-CTERM system associated)
MRIRLLGQYVQLSIAVLAATELVIFAGAFVSAALIRPYIGLSPVGVDTRGLVIRALVFGIVLSLGLLALGLYSSRQRARAGGVAIRLIVGAAAGLAVSTALFLVLPTLRIEEGVLASAAVAVACGVAVSRVTFAQVVDENIFKRKVLVYGSGRNAAAISNLRRRSDRRGFQVMGFVQPEGEICTVDRGQLLDVPRGLSELCSRHGVDEVVVAMEDRRRGFPILELLECRLAGIDVTELLTFLERETGRVRIDVLNPSWMIFGEGFRRDTLRLMSSRGLDILASSAILLLTLPFMIITMIAIKLEEGLSAPVFYAQPRVGLGGRTFNVLKFRSMRTDAEKAGKAIWAKKGDPRVTRVGAFIRKCRIDELPQILCVFRGHMSFVGPRPERPEFVAELAQKIPYYVQRHCVKPGITGWAQLCYPYGSSEQDALEKLQYDLFYIKNNSLLFDMAILLQTAEVVFMGQGAR